MLHKEPNKPDAEQPATTPPSAEPAAKPPDDDLVQRLRAAAKKKRPWNALTWLLTILLIGVPAGLLTWLFWPRVLPPELLVIGFDAVASVAKEATVRAATEPARFVPGEELKHWAGQNVYFQEAGTDRDNRDKFRKAQTNTLGIAELNWPAAKEPGLTTIDVRYVDERRFRHWYDRTQIRLFTWSRDARILVIDIEPTLRHSDNWPGLTKALLEADQAGWHIVYLALDADKPPTYAKARDWIMEQSTQAEDALVAGPVLARQQFTAGESDMSVRKQILYQLKKEFSGALMYLDSSDSLKLHTVDSKGGFSGEAFVVQGWASLDKALGK